MGAMGKALARAGGLTLAAFLSACASSPPRMSPSALEQGIDTQLAQVRALDAEFQAFQAASAPLPPAGGAASAVYYNIAGARLQELEPRHTPVIHQMLSAALEQRGATRFEYRTPQGGAVELYPPWPGQQFEGIPLPVQYAAVVGASPGLRGAESDLRVPLANGEGELVTIWNDSGDRIAAVGSARALPTVGSGGPPADALRARYRIGELEGWSPDELASLDRALALLSPPELAAIVGIPFRRRGTAPASLPTPPASLLGGGSFKRCGSYQWQQGERWIEIYDCAFATEDFGFVGAADHPFAPSVRLIEHEIGHAIAKRRIADLLDRMLQHNNDARTLAEEYNRHKAIPAEQINRYKAMRDKVAVIAEVMNRWNAAVTASGGAASPLLAQFDQVRADTGFTAYGRWNSDEAFAEAFSLYRTDPDACRRISPEVFAFFEAGRHLPAGQGP